MNMLEDTKIDVKLKISALWVTMLFIFAYGDIFFFFKPGIIQDILGGSVAGRQINQAFLVSTTIYILIPSLLVFLSLVLKPTVNRWVNIIVPLLYAVGILYLAITEPEWAFYVLTNIVEVVLLLAIVWFAWKWPKEKKSNIYKN